jgi:hypothetical protein
MRDPLLLGIGGGHWLLALTGGIIGAIGHWP